MIAYRSLVACVAVGLVGCSGASPVTDTGLKAMYEKNATSFEKLAAMFQEDERLQIIDRDGNAEGDAIDKERLAEYRQMIKELGLEGSMFVCLRSNGECLLEIAPRSKADEFEGYEGVGVRGIAFSTKELPVTDRLDTATIDKMSVDEKRYISIAPRWYTFLNRMM